MWEELLAKPRIIAIRSRARGRATEGTIPISASRDRQPMRKGGLILAATNDKKFRAYDPDTGNVIWETDLPASAEGVPAVYEAAGREYIGLCVAAGNGPGAYVVFALPAHK